MNCQCRLLFEAS